MASVAARSASSSSVSVTWPSRYATRAMRAISRPRESNVDADAAAWHDATYARHAAPTLP